MLILAHFAAVDGVVTEFLFDAEELVVFGMNLNSAVGIGKLALKS